MVPFFKKLSVSPSCAFRNNAKTVQFSGQQHLGGLERAVWLGIVTFLNVEEADTREGKKTDLCNRGELFHSCCACCAVQRTFAAAKSWGCATARMVLCGGRSQCCVF